MFNQEQILRAHEVVKEREFLEAYSIAYQVVQQKLSTEVKRFLDEAFPGPTGLGYQNPIELLETVTFIVRGAVSITKHTRNGLTRPLPRFYTPIHHDQTGDVTDEVMGTIAECIGPFHWETSVNWFDGRIYKKGKPYAYVEIGWILPHKIRDLVHDMRVKQLWLFPSDQDSEALAPYYFVVRKASNRKCRKIILEEAKMVGKQLEKVQKARGIR